MRSGRAQNTLGSLQKFGISETRRLPSLPHPTSGSEGENKLVIWHSTVPGRNTRSPNGLWAALAPPGAVGARAGPRDPMHPPPASLPTSMLDLESPITGSSKVRTSSRLEPA